MTKSQSYFYCNRCIQVCKYRWALRVCSSPWSTRSPRTASDKIINSLREELSLAELSRARGACSGAPWVRKFGYPCVLKFGLRKSSVRPYVRPPLHVSRGEILHFNYPRVFAVNRIATRNFSDQNNNNKADSFSRLNFNVYVDVDNREKARARDKRQSSNVKIL